MMTHAQPQWAKTDYAQRDGLLEILASERLSAVFQPIIDFGRAQIVGYEGLVRGPSESALQSPLALFAVARQWNLTRELEQACRRVVLQQFARLNLPGRLFLNVSPECLVYSPAGKENGDPVQILGGFGLTPDRVVIELTEQGPILDYEVLRTAASQFRGLGFEIAIDDLGEGFSSLRLWSELRPSFVKIDRHFIEGVNRDPVKLKFLESIQRIAENAHCTIVAEGIETEAELLTVREMGIGLGQGYAIARPLPNPPTALPAPIAEILGRSQGSVLPQRVQSILQRVTAGSLLIPAPSVAPETHNVEVQRLFLANPDLPAIPVVDREIPVGLINRYRYLEHSSQRYFLDLYGRKPCRAFMDPQPLIVEHHITVQDLSRLLVVSDRRHLADGFIITQGGRYAGIGTGQDLMHHITELQITAARYANPLTLLPGNVPIHEHMMRLLRANTRFTVAYVDLNSFKAFNDRYGYRRGDDVILTLARVLVAHADPEQDFVGHIGGDDCIVLFQSADWERRARAMVAAFAEAVRPLFRPEDLEAGGYIMEDRQGNRVFHPLVAAAIGCVEVQPGSFGSELEIADVASEAKKRAKREPGGVFVNRRRYPQAKQ